MEFFSKAQLFEQVLNIIDGKNGEDDKFNKPLINETSEEYFKEPTKPSLVKLSSSALFKMLKEMETSKEANIHSIVIIKDKKLILNKGFYPYSENTPHVLHSASKTVIALGIGILINKGLLRLDTKLIDILSSEMNLISKLKFSKIMVKHLLTMTSGISVNETVIVSSDDYIKEVIDGNLNFEAGTKFQYNSINTYILSYIIEKITGKTAFEFINEELFSKLNIKDVYWESCQKLHTKGGWGLYMKTLDAAKIGLFIMDKGEINGERIISEDYINEMITPKVITPECFGLKAYGYQLWMGERENSFLFNGMLGQNIHCFPDINTVVAVTGGCSSLFGVCEVNKIIEKYFVKGEALKEDKSKLNLYKFMLKSENLRNLSFNLDTKFSLLNKFKRDKILNKVKEKNFVSDNDKVRLVPFFTRLMNNLKIKGITELKITEENGELFIKIKEDKDETFIPISFSEFVPIKIKIKDGVFKAKAKSYFSFNEENKAVLTISIPFLEHSNGRVLKIIFIDENNLYVKSQDVPGKEIIKEGIISLKDMLQMNRAARIFERVDPYYLNELSKMVTEPETKLSFPV